MSTQEASVKKNRRRQFIVDKPFQYRLIGLLMAIWLANSLFFSIILYYFYEGHIQRFYELVPRPGIAPLLEAPVLFSIAIVFMGPTRRSWLSIPLWSALSQTGNPFLSKSQYQNQ